VFVCLWADFLFRFFFLLLLSGRGLSRALTKSKKKTTGCPKPVGLTATIF
jgi:hypothetical protein